MTHSLKHKLLTKPLYVGSENMLVFGNDMKLVSSQCNPLLSLVFSYVSFTKFGTIFVSTAVTHFSFFLVTFSWKGFLWALRGLAIFRWPQSLVLLLSTFLQMTKQVFLCLHVYCKQVLSRGYHSSLWTVKPSMKQWLSISDQYLAPCLYKSSGGKKAMLLCIIKVF